MHNVLNLNWTDIRQFTLPIIKIWIWSKVANDGPVINDLTKMYVRKGIFCFIFILLLQDALQNISLCRNENELDLKVSSNWKRKFSQSFKAFAPSHFGIICTKFQISQLPALITFVFPRHYFISVAGCCLVRASLRHGIWAVKRTR